jgi:hypothetical protein
MNVKKILDRRSGTRKLGCTLFSVKDWLCIQEKKLLFFTLGNHNNLILNKILRGKTRQNIV